MSSTKDFMGLMGFSVFVRPGVGHIFVFSFPIHFLPTSPSPSPISPVFLFSLFLWFFESPTIIRGNPIFQTWSQNLLSDSTEQLSNNEKKNNLPLLPRPLRS